MTEVILNESMWAENMLSKRSLGKAPINTLNSIARCYFASGYKKKEIPRLLELFLVRCDPNMNITEWDNAIQNAVKRCDKRKPIDIKGVFVTDAEMKKIRELNGNHLERLMFTLLCLAKYENALRGSHKNWVNFSTKDIFNLANIILSVNRRGLLINELYTRGYIDFGEVVDSTSINVKIVDKNDCGDLSDKGGVFIDDFRNLGNRYMMMCGQSYFECNICGLVTRRTSNRQKYCALCAARINSKNVI